MLLKRTKNGLDKVTASIIDVDSSSLFDIFVPKQLRSGKNEIRLRLVNDGLIKGSDILIDILDQNYEPLYYEISEIANEDKSRSIIVYVTETDLTGKAYFYIFAKLSHESSYMALINLEINSKLESEQEIKFSEPPEIFYSEKRLATQTFTNQSRQVIKVNTNGTLSTISPTIPRQMVESVFAIEKSELKELKSDNSAGSGSVIELPKYFDLAQIVSNNYPFSSSYKNGSIKINGINLEVPNDAISPAPFLNQSYSASIINVNSTSSIEVYPPFSKIIEYQTLSGVKSKVYDRFANQSNFTCSYFESLALSQTTYTQSYAVFDIYKLNPAAGKVDSVNISYKNLSLIGDNYEPLGNFKIRSVNYLIDSGSLFFDNEKGIVDRPIGVFKNGVSDFQAYWQTSSFTTVMATDSISNGIKLGGNDVIFTPKRQFIPVNRNTTEWTLSFDFELQSSQSELQSSQSLAPQLDIFISGSNKIESDIKSKSVLTPIETSGIYIGSVIERTGKGSFNFVVSDNAVVCPKFALRRGFISIGNVSLAPTEKVGYNANQTRIYAPLSLPTGSEINFKFEYINPAGKQLSKFTSLLPGVYFEGSKKPELVLPSGIISGSDQLTGSFDVRYERTGRNIYSSSQQIGPTGIYSGSGIVPYNTIVSASNIKFESSPNDDVFNTGFQFDSKYNLGNSITPYSGSFVLYTGFDGDDVRSYFYADGEEKTMGFTFRRIDGDVTSYISANDTAYASYYSGSEYVLFNLAGRVTSFIDARFNKKGIEYGGNYTASLLANPASLVDVRTVRAMFSSASLFSSSQQVNYNQITNKPTVSGSSLYRILISSGSESASYSHKDLTFDTSTTQSIFNINARTNQNGQLFITGSYTHRLQYIWGGSITPGAAPGIIWTNMPAVKCTWLSSGGTFDDATFIGDFTELSECRLFTSIAGFATGANATSSLIVDYSVDAASWNTLTSVTIGNTGGNKDSGWARLPVSASRFVYIRLMGQGGDGYADPRFSPPILLLR